MRAMARAAVQVRTVAQAATIRGGQRAQFNAAPISRCVVAALQDDLNTCTAVSALLYLADEILDAAACGYGVTDAQASLLALSAVLGLRLGRPLDLCVVEGWRRRFDQAVSHTQRTPGTVAAYTL